MLTPHEASMNLRPGPIQTGISPAMRVEVPKVRTCTVSEGQTLHCAKRVKTFEICISVKTGRIKHLLKEHRYVRLMREPFRTEQAVDSKVMA